MSNLVSQRTDECAVSQETHSRDQAWARCGRRTDRLPRPMRNTGRISVLPAVSLDGNLTVAAQPGSFLRIDIKYFLEEGLVSHPPISTCMCYKRVI
jgi:hypothetical protein